MPIATDNKPKPKQETATLRKAASWALRYYLKNNVLPSDAILKQQFPGLEVTIGQIQSSLKADLANADLDKFLENKKEVADQAEKLEKLDDSIKESKEEYRHHQSQPQLAQTKRNTISAMGVLAEIDVIEPTLKKHQQEAITKIQSTLVPEIKKAATSLNITTLPTKYIEALSQKAIQDSLKTISQSTIQTPTTSPGQAPASPPSFEKILSDNLTLSMGNIASIDPDLRKQLAAKSAAAAAQAVASNRETVQAVTLISSVKQAVEDRDSTAKQLNATLNEQIKELVPQLGVNSLSPEKIETVTKEIAQQTTVQTMSQLPQIVDPAQIPDVLKENLTQILLADETIGPKFTNHTEALEQKVAPVTAQIASDLGTPLQKATVASQLIDIAKVTKPQNLETPKLVEPVIVQKIDDQHPMAADLQPVFAGTANNFYLPSYRQAIEKEITPHLQNGTLSFHQLQISKENAHQTATRSFIEQTTKALGSQNAKMWDLHQFPSEIAFNLRLRPVTVQRIEESGRGYAAPNLTSFTPNASRKNYGFALSLASRSKTQKETFHALIAHQKSRMDSEVTQLQKEVTAYEQVLKTKRSLKHIQKVDYEQKKRRLEVLLQSQKFSQKNPKKFKAAIESLRDLFGTQGVTSSSNTAWNILNSQRNLNPFVKQKKIVQQLSSSTFGSWAYKLKRFQLDFSIKPVFRYITFGHLAFAGGPAGQSITFYSRPSFVTGGRFNPAAFRGMASQFQGAIGGVRSIAGTAKNIKNALQMGGLALKGGLAAAEATNPLGWAMLAAQLAPKLKKIAMAAAALAAALLLALAGKIIGALTGLAFGAVTGLPLLLIPGFGLPLYGAWVLGWGAYGFINPAGMIGLAQNTLSFITNLPGTIGSLFSGVGGAASGILGSIGSTVTGAASAAWGGITSLGGAIIGGSSAFLGGIVTFAGSFFVPAIAIAAPVIGLFVGLPVLNQVLNMKTSASLFSNQIDKTTAPNSGDNQYFTVTKTANPASMNNPGQNIGFAITLTNKNSKLSGIKLNEALSVSGKNNNNFQVTTDANNKPIADLSSPPCQNSPPTQMNPNEKWTCQFAIKTDSSSGHDFKDTLISNTVTVKATPEGQNEVNASTTATATIGNPPADCPSGWPTQSSGGHPLTQGPQGYPDHHDLFPAEQAIDIGVGLGTQTVATFNGTVTLVENQDGLHYGLHVDVQGTCNGKQFTARWAHLNSAQVSPGSHVTKGQTIGLTGSSGNSTGPHLHYSFFGLEMKKPYVPSDIIPNNCGDSPGPPCSISW